MTDARAPRTAPRRTRGAASLAVTIALALGSAPPEAAAATLSGFLSDAKNGESIAFASVFVRNETVSTGSMSNENGYYAVAGLAPGTYVVHYSAFGYAAVWDTIAIAPGRDVRRDVKLEVEAIELETIDVAGSRDEVEEKLQTGFVQLDARELQRMPAVIEEDIIRSLQLLPGIQSASDISSGLYVRGGGPDQTLILLDQIPLYNPTHAFGFFSTFNGDAIKDVTLYKGAYPAKYGGRLGAVLDVSNREGNRNEFEGKAGISLIAGRLTLEGPVGRGSYMVSGRRTYLEPLLSAIRTEDNEIPKYYFYDLNARVNQSVGESDIVTASGYFGRDDLKLDLDEGSFVNFRWGNSAVTGKWTHIFNPVLFGNFLVAASEYQSTTDLSLFKTPIIFKNRLLDLTAKADFDYYPGANHVVTTGLRASTFDFRFESEFNYEPQTDLRLRPNSFVWYLQDEWQAGPATQLRVGLHTEYFSEGKRWVAEPRLSISQGLRPGVRLKAGGGTYHQFLQLVSTEGFSGADFWVPTDETVEPGRSWQGVLGLEWEPSSQYSASIETYYTDLEHLLQFDNDVAADNEATETAQVFKTDGTGYATGMELFAEKRTGRLTGWIGYTLGWSRRTFAEINKGQRYPPKYDRRHDLSVVASWRRGKWQFGGNLIYATGQAFTPAGARYTQRNPATGLPPRDDLILAAEKNSARLLPYHRIDVRVARDGRLFGLPAEYYLQIFNIYSRRNEWFIQYDTASSVTEPEVIRQLPIIPTIGVNFAF